MSWLLNTSCPATSASPSMSLSQLIQNISLQNTSSTTDLNTHQFHDPSQPRGETLAVSELPSMMALESGSTTVNGSYPVSFPASLSHTPSTALNLNQQDSPIQDADFTRSSHNEHNNHASLRHSFQQKTTFQGCTASQYLVLVNGIADRAIDSTIDAAASLSVAPGVHAMPILRRSHKPETFKAESPLHRSMPTFSRTDIIPYEGYHYGGSSHPLSNPLLPMDASRLQIDEDYGYPAYLSSSAPSSEAPNHGQETIPTTESTSILSSSLPARMISPSFSPSLSSCYSPALSTSSLILDMRQISFENMSASGCNDSENNSTYSDSYSQQQNKNQNKNENKNSNEKKSVRFPRETKRFACEIDSCTRVFSRYYNLKSHMLTHGIHRPHACQTCWKTFSRVHDRNRHMNSHRAEKPHVCIVCLTRFGRQDAVIRHLKLANEMNPCSCILKSKGITFREAAAGRVLRQSLGEETEIRQKLEVLEEHARMIKATRTFESLSFSRGSSSVA